MPHCEVGWNPNSSACSSIPTWQPWPFMLRFYARVLVHQQFSNQTFTTEMTTPSLKNVMIPCCVVLSHWKDCRLNAHQEGAYYLNYHLITILRQTRASNVPLPHHCVILQSVHDLLLSACRDYVGYTAVGSMIEPSRARLVRQMGGSRHTS